MKTGTRVALASVLAGILLLGAGSVYAATEVAHNNAIGTSAAENFALINSGVDVSSVKDMKTKFVYRKGQFVYLVSFSAGGAEYEYEINSADGSILDREDGDRTAIATAFTNPDTAKAAGAGENGAAAGEAAAAGETPAASEDGAAAGAAAGETPGGFAETAPEGNSAGEETTGPAAEDTEGYITAGDDVAEGSEDSMIVEETPEDTSEEASEETAESSETSIGSGFFADWFRRNTTSVAAGAETESDPEGYGGDVPQTEEGEEIAITEAQELSVYLISIDSIKNIAVKDAGYTVDEVTFSKTKIEEVGPRYIYEVDFYISGYAEYEYEIDAETGKIVYSDVTYAGEESESSSSYGIFSIWEYLYGRDSREEDYPAGYGSAGGTNVNEAPGSQEPLDPYEPGGAEYESAGTYGKSRTYGYYTDSDEYEFDEFSDEDSDDEDSDDEDLADDEFDEDEASEDEIEEEDEKKSKKSRSRFSFWW